MLYLGNILLRPWSIFVLSTTPLRLDSGLVTYVKELLQNDRLAGTQDLASTTGRRRCRPRSRASFRAGASCQRSTSRSSGSIRWSTRPSTPTDRWPSSATRWHDTCDLLWLARSLDKAVLQFCLQWRTLWNFYRLAFIKYPCQGWWFFPGALFINLSPTFEPTYVPKERWKRWYQPI